MDPIVAASIVQCPNCATKNRLKATEEGVPRCARCQHLLPWVVEADDASFDEEVRASVPVVADFWAPWCGPCRMVTPVLERLAQDHAGHIKVVKVNVDENPELGRRFGAMSIPLLVVLRGGEEVDRIVGALPPRQLEERLAPVMDAA
jgi:thioredoxin 2